MARGAEERFMIQMTLGDHRWIGRVSSPPIITDQTHERGCQVVIFHHNLGLAALA
jgi:hypothetical protein